MVTLGCAREPFKFFGAPSGNGSAVCANCFFKTGGSFFPFRAAMKEKNCVDRLIDARSENTQP